MQWPGSCFSGLRCIIYLWRCWTNGSLLGTVDKGYSGAFGQFSGLLRWDSNKTSNNWELLEGVDKLYIGFLPRYGPRLYRKESRTPAIYLGI